MNERCIGTLCPFYEFKKREDPATEQPWMKATCLGAGVQLFDMRDTGQFVEELLLGQRCVVPPAIQRNE